MEPDHYIIAAELFILVVMVTIKGGPVTVPLSIKVKKYLALVAEEHIDGEPGPWSDQDYKRQMYRDDLWGRMSPQDRDDANELVQDIFGKWI